MNSPAVDVMNLLSDLGVGIPAGETGWSLWVGDEPPSPDTAITIYDTGGYEPLYSTYIEHPTVQVRVRGSPYDYVVAHKKIQGIKELLISSDGVIINDTGYSFWLQGDLSFLYNDENSRPVFVCNFRMMRR